MVTETLGRVNLARTGKDERSDWDPALRNALVEWMGTVSTPLELKGR